MDKNQTSEALRRCVEDHETNSNILMPRWASYALVASRTFKSSGFWIPYAIVVTLSLLVESQYHYQVLDFCLTRHEAQLTANAPGSPGESHGDY